MGKNLLPPSKGAFQLISRAGFETRPTALLAQRLDYLSAEVGMGSPPERPLVSPLGSSSPPFISTFLLELPLKNLPHSLDGIRLFWTLVVPEAGDTSEAQG